MKKGLFVPTVLYLPEISFFCFIDSIRVLFYFYLHISKRILFIQLSLTLYSQYTILITPGTFLCLFLRHTSASDWQRQHPGRLLLKNPLSVNVTTNICWRLIRFRKYNVRICILYFSYCDKTKRFSNIFLNLNNLLKLKNKL